MAALDARDDPAGVEAAERVMLELWSILGAYRDTLTLVGGSAPPLLLGELPDDPSVGALDVDLVVDPLGIPDDTYRTIAEGLRERGYWFSVLLRDALDDSGCEETEAISFEPGAQAWEGISSMGSNAVA